MKLGLDFLGYRRYSFNKVFMKKAVRKRSMLIPPDRESACPSGGVRALREGKAEGSFGAGELNEGRMRWIISIRRGRA